MIRHAQTPSPSATPHCAGWFVRVVTRWHDQVMAGEPGLEINVDLFEALVLITGDVPKTPEPIVALSAFLYSLAKGYGLSDSQQLTESQLERADPPPPAIPLINHFLADGAAGIEPEHLRTLLYSTFLELSRDGRARSALNKNEPLSEMGLLKVAQVFWNLEATAGRTSLPISPGRITDSTGKTIRADIKVPDMNKDFAAMKWTERTTYGANGLGAGQAYKSSGQGFRKQGARLAVLAAQRIIQNRTQPPPDLGGAILSVTSPTLGKPRASIIWPRAELPLATPTAVALEEVGSISSTSHSVVPDTYRRAELDTLQQIRVGKFGEVGSGYQPRGFDAEIERIWADGGDRRVWLRGGPGLGKSYSARRVMQDAISNRGPDRDDVLIWVDSADAGAVISAFSAVVEKMPRLAISADKGAQQPEMQARNLLDALATSDWRWLIVLDNADPRSLFDERLIPTGSNPNGRVLITTLSQDHRMPRHGRVVAAASFDEEEAEGYLRGQVDPGNGRPAPLAGASAAETKQLAEAVAHHPLALSIASATIIANAMEVSEWIAEFRDTATMDAAADEADGGGYPHLIGASWKIALQRAASGLPPGTVERAAAVAAVLDPDGHPVWLWDRDRVADWVAGGEPLARSHGRPVAIQRLIDNGIVGLVGDTWKSGTVAIHQLAARAVRELFPTSDLAELGEILTDEWLLRVVEDGLRVPSGLRSNVQSLMSSIDLTDRTRATAAALLGFSGFRGYADDSDDFDPSKWAKAELAGQQEEYEVIASVIDHVGPRSKHIVAAQAAYLGHLFMSLDRQPEAREHYSRAAQIYRGIIDDRNVDDSQRAEALADLAGSLEEIDRSDEARESRVKAAGIYERLAGADPGVQETFDHVSALAELHEKLGPTGQGDATLARYYEQLMRIVDLEPVQAEDGPPVAWAHARRLKRLADYQRTVGKLEDAKVSLMRAAAVYRSEDGWEGFVRRHELAVIRLQVETSCWTDAEAGLARLVDVEGRPDDSNLADDLVRFASIRSHRGHSDDADVCLARAAEIYQSIAPKPRSDIEQDEDPEPPGLDRLALFAGKEFMSGRWDNAQQTYARLIALTQDRADASPGDYEGDLAHAFAGIAMTFVKMGQPSQAKAPLTRAVSIRQTLADLAPNDNQALDNLAAALSMLGLVHKELGNLEDSIDAHRRATETRRLLAESDPGSRDVQGRLALALLGLGSALTQGDRLDEALDAFNGAVAIDRTLTDLDPDDSDAQDSLAGALRMLGDVLLSHDRPDEAADCWAEQVSILEGLAARDSGAQEPKVALAKALVWHAWTYSRNDRAAEAKDGYERATRMLRDILQGNPQSGEVIMLAALAHGQLAQVHDQLGNVEGQVHHLAAAVDLHRRQVVEDPSDVQSQLMLADTLTSLGNANRQRDRDAEAVDDLLGAANILHVLVEMAPEGPPSATYDWQRTLRDCLKFVEESLRNVGRSDDADGILRRADELDRKFPHLDTPGED